jgi:hypothetical protein
MSRKKTSDERPMMLMVREIRKVGGDGLYPATSADQEMLARYAVGKTLEIRTWQNRSPDQLRLYWGLLNECVANGENKYGSSEDLHEAIKYALGYQRRIVGLDGNIIIFPGSISFKAMDQSAFNVFFDGAKAQLNAAGYPVDEFLEAIKEDYKQGKSYRNGRSKATSWRNTSEEVIWDETEDAA